ncbi:MAG: hypothetical protein C0418_06195 [Coriobacteriaceae bacterium]|nr:hypothetical protein [Coriobacteriaceae bacterium]
MPRSTSTQHGARATARKSPGKGDARRASASRSRGGAPRTRPAPAAKRPRKAPARSRAPYGPLVAIAVIAVLAWTFYPVLRVQYREERTKAQLEAELGALKTRNAGLQTQVERLKTPEGVEDVARETLGLVREGERAYVVVDGEATATTARIEPVRAPELTETVLTQVLDAVFGVQ